MSKTTTKRTVTIEITSCEKCSNCTTRKVYKVYTEDSFETVRSLHCEAMKDKKITELDWNEDFDFIPEWCPLLKKKKKKK